MYRVTEQPPDDLTPEMTARLAEEFEPNERVVWAARTAPHRFLARKRLVALPAALALLDALGWIALCFMDLLGAQKHGDSLNVALGAGVISRLAIAWLVVGLRWAKQPSPRFQVMTERRLLVFTSTAVTSLPQPTITTIRRRRYSNACDDVILTLSNANGTASTDVTLFGVADARSLEALTRGNSVIGPATRVASLPGEPEVRLDEEALSKTTLHQRSRFQGAALALCGGALTN